MLCNKQEKIRELKYVSQRKMVIDTATKEGEMCLKREHADIFDVSELDLPKQWLAEKVNFLVADENLIAISKFS